MTSSHRRFLGIVAGFVLLAIGYVAGRLSSMRHEAANVANIAVRPPRPEAHGFPLVNKSPEIKGDWGAQWTQLSAQPRSPAADEKAAAILEKFAEQDPSRALALAMKERNRARRTVWLHAVLRGWAAVAPTAAAEWISTLPVVEHEGAETAVMDGAARNPASATALAQQLIEKDPQSARSHANQLLRVLNQRGDFEAGVDFAARLPEPIRAEMLGTAFQYWALSQPERAFDVAAKLPVGDSRKTALDAAISGWAHGDPSGLAEFALNLSSTSDRTEVLQTALREWVQLNPKAASEWIDRFEPKPEFDAGAAAVALHPDVLAKRPEIAASWAESITDPELRSNTLVNVLKEWANRDAAAALNYAQKNTSTLKPADREALLTELTQRSNAL